MRGKLTRRAADRLENLAIVLLSCSALFLLGWIGTMQHLGGPWQSGAGGTSFSGGRTAAAERYRPGAMLIRAAEGRYGVQYDQAAVDALYRSGPDRALEEALTATERPEEISEEQWRDAVTGEDPWIWYDYLYDIPCPGWEYPGGGGVRGFLLVGEGDLVRELLLWSDSGRTFCRCALREGTEIRLPTPPAEENGAYFAFEREESFCKDLSPVGMLLPDSGDLPACVSRAPLVGLGADAQRKLMAALSFNPSAVSLYETSSGTVIREGADTLRLEKDGTLIFRSGFGGESRYQAASNGVSDQIDRAVELMDRILPDREDGTRMVCQKVILRENGETELRFCCLLNGVEVRQPDGAAAARFLFRGAGLAGFSVRVRTYELREGTIPVVPVRQAAAMLIDLDRKDGELRLCYQDHEDGALTAGWVLRMPTETEQAETGVGFWNAQN